MSQDPADELAEMARIEDPWIMYMVVRRSRLQSASPLEMLEAAARGVLELPETPFARTVAGARVLAAWAAESQRKVVLRAREGEWERLIAAGNGAVVDLGGQPGLLCRLPVLRSERGPLLSRLQVLEATPAQAQAPAQDAAAGASLLLDGSLGMSLGKQMAQIGHGAQALVALGEGPDPAGRLASWRSRGRPLTVQVVDTERLAASEGQADVVVRDAGLTEIARGSRTVLVFAP